MRHNVENIERLLAAAAPGGKLLDLGCDDGSRTHAFAGAAGASEVHGLELIEERAKIAEKRGVRIEIADLNECFPYSDGTFDVVVSNQVLEHLWNVGNFLRETCRVLRPGGIVVASTENLASWHNVFALLFGWQPFSTTNVAREQLGLGNPLALHRGDGMGEPGWEHVQVFAYRGLGELFESHGFVVERIEGAGYYPLPSVVGRHEPRHAAFLTLRGRR
jgi:SAM-dependent methyltransferase